MKKGSKGGVEEGLGAPTSLVQATEAHWMPVPRRGLLPKMAGVLTQRHVAQRSTPPLPGHASISPAAAAQSTTAHSGGSARSCAALQPLCHEVLVRHLQKEPWDQLDNQLVQLRNREPATLLDTKSPSIWSSACREKAVGF